MMISLIHASNVCTFKILLILVQFRNLRISFFGTDAIK